MNGVYAGAVTALAPMAGVTDLAFRELCAGMAELYTVTEMVSAKALCYNDSKTSSLMGISPAEKHAAIQLFGSDPDFLARAAAKAEMVSGVNSIDINMGCPIGKIVTSGDGCALMRDIPLASRIVQAVSTAVSLPVTVKFRKGWDGGSVNCVEFALAMQEAGASALCVHGRTRVQLYGGRADWDCIGRVKRAVSIPVAASGDIDGIESALRCRAATGADMYMIGRAAFGNPWLPAQIDAALRGAPILPTPPLRERLATAKMQIARAAELKGERVACLEARRHLAWYLRGVRGASHLRTLVSGISVLADMDRIIKLALEYEED